MLLRPCTSLQENVGTLIRRRATDLLSRCSIFEATWNIKQISAIAKYNMEVEEAALSHLPVEQRIPEKSQRISDTSILDNGYAHNPAPVVLHGYWGKVKG